MKINVETGKRAAMNDIVEALDNLNCTPSFAARTR